jgi:hypothetical protein
MSSTSALIRSKPLGTPPPQVLDDMNKARTDDLADIQPSLEGLKPKLV